MESDGISRAFFAYYLAYLRLRESARLALALLIQRSTSEQSSDEKSFDNEEVASTNSAMRAANQLEENVALVLPVAAIAAFAIELGMKGLISKQGIDPPNCHDLRRLFDQLPQDLRSRIEESVSSECAIERIVFKEKLGQIRQDFINFRYPYGSSKVMSIEAYFAHCLISSIADIYGFRRK